MCGIPMPPRVVPDAVNGRKLTFDQALAHVGTLDDLISDHGRELIRANAKQYLWKYPDKVTRCTACGMGVEGFYGRHGKFYACPFCGARAEFRYEARGHGRVFDEFVLYEWRRSVIDAEAVTLTATWVQRDSTRGHEPHKAMLRTSTTALYVFRPGRAVTVYKKQERWARYGVESSWEQVESVHPEHTKNGTYTGADIVIDYTQFRQAIEGTRIGRVYDLMKAESNTWADLELLAIANCARRPWLEYLAKCGQVHLAAELFRDPHISKSLIPNQRARNPRELLGLTEGQWFEIRRDSVTLDTNLQERLRLLNRLDIGPVKVADAQALDGAFMGTLEYLLTESKLFGGSTIGDMIVRLPDKLRRKIIRRCLRDWHSIPEWRDYYHQLRRLEEVALEGTPPEQYEYDRRVFAPDADPALLLPKDMHAMHARMTEREQILEDALKLKKAEGLRGKFEAAILPKLVKRYTFEAEGLVLRPFNGAAEVIAEGRALNICIGSYTENYMKGSTVICCLRRADDPDTPWRAIEFSTAGIRLQDRGYKNDREKGIPPQTKALLDRFWMAFDEAHQKKGAKSA